jgi:hypothetical protein
MGLKEEFWQVFSVAYEWRLKKQLIIEDMIQSYDNISAHDINSWFVLRIQKRLTKEFAEYRVHAVAVGQMTGT